MKIVPPFRPLPGDTREREDLAKAIYTFMWIEIGVLTLMWLSLSLIYPGRFAGWSAFYIPSLAASLFGLYLNGRGEARRAVVVILVSFWIVITVFAVAYSNIIPPNSNRYVLAVVAAGLMLGKRAAVLTAAVSGLAEIVFVLLMNAGIINSTPGHFSLFGLFFHLFVLCLAALLPTLATRSVRNALRSAKEELDERRRSEEIALENEARFKALVDNSPDAIMIHRDGRFVHLNSASLEMLKASCPDEFVGKPIMEIVHPDYRHFVATVLDQMRRTGTSSQIREGKMLRLDGSVADVETVSMPVTFDGSPAIQTIVRDVTDTKLLQEQMRLQVTALNSAANGIVIADRQGTILWVNAAFETLTGYTFTEAVGKNPRDLVKSGKQKAPFYKDMWQCILAGNVWRGELVNRRKDKSLYTEYMTLTPVHDEHGEVTHFVAVKQDITSQKLLEEQLLQSQKLEGIGQLAGGVAHDYNNILNVVVGYGELLRRKVAKDDPSRQPLDAIVSAARRGADLTRQLLAFARKEIVSPRVVNMNSAVDSIRNMLQRIIGENIRLVFIPGKDLWNMMMDATQFDQILVNLATNSRDAIKDIGDITIRTGNVHVTDGYAKDLSDPEGREFVRGLSDIASGEYVKLTFEDNGKGMDAETLKRIFEPFFTTKPKGHGTGLGLSTVYGIVKQNAGAINAASEFGKGSSFCIYLPRFVGDAPEPDEELPDESLKGTETILVVEDQADLLNLAKTSLEEYGYNVMTSLDPADAELLSEAYAGEIHLLLSDIIMPKLGGRELSRRITEGRPGMRTLYMSGYGSKAFDSDNGPEKEYEFIQKPFSLQELARKIREVLSAADGKPR